MSRHPSYSHIYNVQRTILLVFYITTAIALSVPLVRFVAALSPDHFYPLVITLLLYMLLAVVVGSMIHVISYIPFNLATAFDPVKNDMASGKITDLKQLGERITSFTVDFFNFSFLDITHAYIQTEGTGLISHEKNEQLEQLLSTLDMLEQSKHLEEIVRAGKITLPQRDYHLYILPIWFGNRWLGYMALLSEKRIGRFFQRFLMEYENNFLDDQIMHMIHFVKR